MRSKVTHFTLGIINLILIQIESYKNIRSINLSVYCICMYIYLEIPRLHHMNYQSSVSIEISAAN